MDNITHRLTVIQLGNGKDGGHPLIAPINTHSVQVHHFKWDETSIERIKRVADTNKDYSYSDEYMKMYKELEKSKF